jgi:Domain of unknown function (DUF4384)
MRFRLSKTCLIAAAVLSLIVPAILGPGVEAQKQGAPLWYSVVTVKRVEKPNRQPTHPAPKTGRQRAALLTLQWHLLQRITDTKQEEADSSREFQTGDLLKLAITANQTGYLYIVNQPEGKDGVLLFPDIRINNGQNRVVKDKEYIIPSYCPDFEDPNDCWFKMAPPAGTETLIVIFSRDKITTLPNKISKPSSPVARALVEQLISSSEQNREQFTADDLKIPGRKTVRYATRVQNTNRQDNEELIATIELRHSE